MLVVTNKGLFNKTMLQVLKGNASDKTIETLKDLGFTFDFSGDWSEQNYPVVTFNNRSLVISKDRDNRTGLFTPWNRIASFKQLKHVDFANYFTKVKYEQVDDELVLKSARLRQLIRHNTRIQELRTEAYEALDRLTDASLEYNELKENHKTA